MHELRRLATRAMAGIAIAGALGLVLYAVGASLNFADIALVLAVVGASLLGYASGLAAALTAFVMLIVLFTPPVGEFVIPDLLGGSDTLMIGRQLWSEFFSNRDWPLASAVAILLLIILVVPIVIYRDVEARRVDARP